jgi:hypothetical protein
LGGAFCPGAPGGHGEGRIGGENLGEHWPGPSPLGRANASPRRVGTMSRQSNFLRLQGRQRSGRLRQNGGMARRLSRFSTPRRPEGDGDGVVMDGGCANRRASGPPKPAVCVRGGLPGQSAPSGSACSAIHTRACRPAMAHVFFPAILVTLGRRCARPHALASPLTVSVRKGDASALLHLGCHLRYFRQNRLDITLREYETGKGVAMRCGRTAEFSLGVFPVLNGLSWRDVAFVELRRAEPVEAKRAAAADALSTGRPNASKVASPPEIRPIRWSTQGESDVRLALPVDRRQRKAGYPRRPCLGDLPKIALQSPGRAGLP